MVLRTSPSTELLPFATFDFFCCHGPFPKYRADPKNAWCIVLLFHLKVAPDVVRDVRQAREIFSHAVMEQRIGTNFIHGRVNLSRT